MSAPKRKREVQVNFRVSPEELALIEKKMSQLGTNNREAYLRKMAKQTGGVCPAGLFVPFSKIVPKENAFSFSNGAE